MKKKLNENNVFNAKRFDITFEVNIELKDKLF